MKKLCWLIVGMSPYSIKLLNEVSKTYETQVIVDIGKEKNRNNEWKLDNNNNFKTYFIDENYKQKIKEFAKEYDIFFDGEYMSKYGHYAVSEFKKNNKITILKADGGIAKNRGFVLNTFQSYMMKRHDYFMSSSNETSSYFTYYGVDPNKIILYKFTSLTNEDIKTNKELIKNKNEHRKQLNIDDKFTLISVGQPIRRKGFDILLNSYIKTGLTDKINLYIIGGKPQEEIKKIVDDNKLINVHFIDLISSNELKKYYAASDSFVLCTREDIWGLVIQEAMSFGLPVITSNNCVCGNHFNKINNSVIVCDVNDEEAYSHKIKELYEDKDLLKEYSIKALETVEEYTIENSAKDVDIIIQTLSK